MEIYLFMCKRSGYLLAHMLTFTDSPEIGMIDYNNSEHCAYCDRLVMANNRKTAEQWLKDLPEIFEYPCEMSKQFPFNIEDIEVVCFKKS